MAACACFLDGAFKLLCVINITPRKKTSCFFNQCDVLFSQLKKNSEYLFTRITSCDPPPLLFRVDQFCPFNHIQKHLRRQPQ